MEWTRICGHCGATNRVPARHLPHAGKCGSCREPLLPQAVPLDVDQHGFDDVVTHVEKPVLIDFYADWCAPCRAAAPEVAALARELAGQVVVLKVNTEKQPALAGRFNIRSIPTFVVLHHGKTIIQRAGMVNRQQMEQWLH